MLANFGQSISSNSEAAAFDFDGDGLITMYDFLQMLSQQPPINDKG